MQGFSARNDLQLYLPYSYNKNSREEANYTWRTESRIAGVNLGSIDTNVVQAFNAISCNPLKLQTLCRSTRLTRPSRK
jgi:hypothetical protein